ncbi:MAG: fatty acid desaturase family protein [Methylococcaceae bacterium]|nr:fatty acid desaturase family protein [Methylococcaceae bacterium]
MSNTDKYNGSLNKYIDKSTLKELSQIKQWRGLVQIFVEWVGIFSAILLCEEFMNPLFYILTVFWIGARLNALAVLMHEATHYRLMKNRKLNDWVGDVFCAWPAMMTVYAFRKNHFAHHHLVNKPGDPDWKRKQVRRFESPKSKKEILWITLRYLSGSYFFTELKIAFSLTSNMPNKVKIPRTIFILSVVAASIVFNFWLGLIMYWLVPMSTYFLWITYVRGVAEHFAGIEGRESMLHKTRHIEANFLERLMLAPNFIHIHIAHHIYPSVPFYNLPKLHKTLLQNEEYANNAHITQNYWALIKEWSDGAPVRG